MTKLIDITGMKFGRWTVIRKVKSKSRTRWLCRCECGTEKEIQGAGITSGRSKSCGCLRAELPMTNLLKSVTRHGKTNTPTWKSWWAMIKRCSYKNAINFERYGGRGISVCERWKNFENFLADMGERPTGMSIDRINVDGNYEPSNCRWATALEQNRNTSKTVFVELSGKKLSIAEAAEIIGVQRETIKRRIKKGIPINRKSTGENSHA